jgi:SulP family sulfate permease
MDADLDFASRQRLRALPDGAAGGANRACGTWCLFRAADQPHRRHRVEVLGQVIGRQQASGITVHVSGMKLPVGNRAAPRRPVTRRAALKLYRTDVDALLAFGRLGA